MICNWLLWKFVILFLGNDIDNEGFSLYFYFGLLNQMPISSNNSEILNLYSLKIIWI